MYNKIMRLFGFGREIEKLSEITMAFGCFQIPFIFENFLFIGKLCCQKIMQIGMTCFYNI